MEGFSVEPLGQNFLQEKNFLHDFWIYIDDDASNTLQIPVYLVSATATQSRNRLYLVEYTCILRDKTI